MSRSAVVVFVLAALSAPAPGAFAVGVAGASPATVMSLARGAGPFVVVDGKGRMVDRVVGLDPPVSIIREVGGMLWNYDTSTGRPWTGATAYYLSWDCSGTPYSLESATGRPYTQLPWKGIDGKDYGTDLSMKPVTPKRGDPVSWSLGRGHCLKQPKAYLYAGFQVYWPLKPVKAPSPLPPPLTVRSVA